MQTTLKTLAILCLLSFVLAACAGIQSNEGDQGPTKMRKSPCAELWTARHV